MKTLTGTVITNSMEKTVKVLVTRHWQHPFYKKNIKKSKKYLAHTDKKIKLGTEVIIKECRPISKNKKWQVVDIIKK